MKGEALIECSNLAHVSWHILPSKIHGYCFLHLHNYQLYQKGVKKKIPFIIVPHHSTIATSVSQLLLPSCRFCKGIKKIGRIYKEKEGRGREKKKTHFKILFSEYILCELFKKIRSKRHYRYFKKKFNDEMYFPRGSDVWILTPCSFERLPRQRWDVIGKKGEWCGSAVGNAKANDDFDYKGCNKTVPRDTYGIDTFNASNGVSYITLHVPRQLSWNREERKQRRRPERRRWRSIRSGAVG